MQHTPTYQVVIMPTNSSSFECAWEDNKSTFAEAAAVYAEKLSEVLGKPVEPPKNFEAHHTYQDDHTTAWICKIYIPKTEML